MKTTQKLNIPSKTCYSTFSAARKHSNNLLSTSFHRSTLYLFAKQARSKTNGTFTNAMNQRAEEKAKNNNNKQDKCLAIILHLNHTCMPHGIFSIIFHYLPICSKKIQRSHFYDKCFPFPMHKLFRLNSISFVYTIVFF